MTPDVMDKHLISDPNDLLQIEAESGDMSEQLDQRGLITLGLITATESDSVELRIGVERTNNYFSCLGRIILTSRVKLLPIEIFSKLALCTTDDIRSVSDRTIIYATDHDLANGIFHDIELDYELGESTASLGVTAQRYDASQPFHENGGLGSALFSYEDTDVDETIFGVGQCVSRVANFIHSLNGNTRRAQTTLWLPGVSLHPPTSSNTDHLPDAAEGEDAQEKAPQELKQILPPIATTKEAAEPADEEAAITNFKRDPYEGFPSFDDFGGLTKEIARLRDYASDVATPPAMYDKYGVTRPKALLIQGPGGVGKTELVKALSRELGANYYPVRVSSITSKWVGEPVQNLRRIFVAAQEHSQTEPVLLFFDEADGLFSTGAGGSQGASSALVAEFKAILNESPKYPGITIVVATNRDSGFDPALLRAGRFETPLIIPTPDEDTLSKIFIKKITPYFHLHEFGADFDDLDLTPDDIMETNDPVGTAIRFDLLAQAAAGMTGSDVTTILEEVRKRKMRHERQTGTSPAKITHQDIAAVIDWHRKSQFNQG
ncbi:MAG: family ATPase, subfamily [Candidatus Saccharibacteria bacterium]|nr:family ATPase, subfamily [Candidatus Saccharibacteria bacterium]